LNCPCHDELIIALAPVTVELRFNVVV